MTYVAFAAGLVVGALAVWLPAYLDRRERQRIRDEYTMPHDGGDL
jgi:hypothetical protein